MIEERPQFNKNKDKSACSGGNGSLTIYNHNFQGVSENSREKEIISANDDSCKEGIYRIRRQNDDNIRFTHSMAEYNAEKNTVMGAVQDITERKESEKVLAEEVS